MVDATFVQGDTDPDVSAILHDEDDPTKVLDLSTALGVRFQMRKADDREYTVDAAAAVDDAPAGAVHYTWSTNDLAIPGVYLVQWQVTKASGRIQTSIQKEIEVRRQ
jgi:hypothetical protein